MHRGKGKWEAATVGPLVVPLTSVGIAWQSPSNRGVETMPKRELPKEFGPDLGI